MGDGERKQGVLVVFKDGKNFLYENGTEVGPNGPFLAVFNSTGRVLGLERIEDIQRVFNHEANREPSLIQPARLAGITAN